MKRLFLGIPIHEDIADYLNQQLKKAADPMLAGFRFSPKGNHHLTLRFLGETPVEKCENVIEATQSVSKNSKQFYLKINRIDRFPNPKSRVIAAYVEINAPLKHLQKRCESAMVNSGYHPEKYPFIPHITLGRSKPVAQTIFKTLLLPETEIKVTSFYLYESHIGSTGSQYEVVEFFKLSP